MATYGICCNRKYARNSLRDQQFRAPAPFSDNLRPGRCCRAVLNHVRLFSRNVGRSGRICSANVVPNRPMFRARGTYVLTSLLVPVEGYDFRDTRHQGWIEIAALGASHADGFRRSEEELLVACGGRLRLGYKMEGGEIKETKDEKLSTAPAPLQMSPMLMNER